MKKNVLIFVLSLALVISAIINTAGILGGETTVDLEQDRIHFNQLFDTISHHEYKEFQTTFIEQEDTTYQNLYISKELSFGTRDFMSFDGTDNDYNTHRTFQV